jgi:hypothetical protein
MEVIKYEDYKQEILDLVSAGVSGREIARRLSSKYNRRFHDTGISAGLRRWRAIAGEKSPYLVASPAKVLILDIETAPIRAYVWRLWKENVSPSQLISDWFVLTWSAKWLFSDNTMSDKLTPKEAIAQDDKRIMESLWKLMEEASVVIAHNAKKFDIPKVNARFVIHGMPPPMSYEVIDTLLHARKQWKMSSNRLDYLCKVLGLDRKTDTGGFELWDRCMQGDKDALLDMETYNIQDVLILEELYLRMRAWIKPHPNMNLHIADNVASCPTCGNHDLDWRGDYNTTMNTYSAFRCNTCGSQGRSRKANKQLKGELPSSVPR